MSEKVGEIFYSVTLDTSKMVEGSRAARRELDGLGTRLTATAAAAAVLAAAFVAIKVAKLADEIRMLGARVDVAAGSVERGAAAFNELVAISRRTQSSLGGNIEVFNRLNQSILQMGGSQEDTLQTTELLGKAIKVSGASATEAKAAMLQFGQALGSGKLQGDELRSLMETAPYLMRQLADGIGVPVGALKKLGEEGKLTADVVMNALSKAAEKIDADFKKLPQTFESAMTVAQDQAALAALKFDELTGGSAALAGVTKGLGDVFEELGKQFEGATTEADKLGRNSSVSNWADTTKVALSYLVDAVDLTWQSISVLGRNVKFVFESIGAEIGGLMAASMANAKRDWAGVRAIRQQMKEDSEKRRKELDDADAKTLGKAMLAGERMRQAWAAPQASYSNEGRMPTPTRGPLKSAGGGGDTKGAKFDSAGYMAGLEKAAATGYERVDAIEREALRKNAELLKAGKITRQQAADAVLLIEENAARERQEIGFKEATDNLNRITADGQKEAAARLRLEEERKRGQVFAESAIAGDDPVAQLQLRLQRELELNDYYASIDLENAEKYAAARLAIESDTAKEIAEVKKRQRNQTLDQQAMTDAMVYAMAQSAAGQMLDVLKRAGKERSTLGKSLFLAERALAVATIILNTELGAAKAIGIAGPFGIPLATAIRATGYASAGMVAGLAVADAFGGGRQYGGPVAAGSMYRVGEGNRPEMFVGDSGRSYMIPGERGKVISNGELGGAAGGAPWKVVVLNAPAGYQPATDSDSRSLIIDMAATQAEARVANSISQNTGPVWSALRGATNVQGRL